MSKLTILANVFAKNDMIELVKTELIKLIAATRAETGCINYNLHQDNDNQTHFMLYENWQNREALLAHMNTPHFKQYLVATEDAVESFTLNEMTSIN